MAKDSYDPNLLPDDPLWMQPLVFGDPYDGGTPGSTPKSKFAHETKQFEDAQKKVAHGDHIPYAKSTVAHSPDPGSTVIKTAQASGINNMMTNPMWFSPLHTPQNWQIASKRREIYQWMLVSGCELTTYDHTSVPVERFVYTSNSCLEDSLTGGLLYENIQSDPIMSGSGAMRNPVHFSIRECFEKRCFEICPYGHWRSVTVSEEHNMIVLDGKLYRHKKKIHSNAKYRRTKGIRPNGVKKVFIPDNLIFRKKSMDVSVDDYLLAPAPICGSKSLNYSDAWLIGLCLADGSVAKGKNQTVGYTVAKNEAHLPQIRTHLEEWGAYSEKIHYNSDKTKRISLHDRDFHTLVAAHVTGKLTKKKATAKVFELDKESRLHLLGGYFDGDGCFNDELKLVANNYSCDMADQIYWLLLSVGIKASLGKYKVDENHYETDSEWYYRIFVPSSDVPKLQPYMRSDKIPADFETKKTRELRFFYEEDGITYLAQPIEYIKQFKYTGPGYDLQIDPERSFVASGYVTSNCRFWYENEPKVAAAIDFYSRFPMNGFILECESRKILDFFEHFVVNKLKLNEMFKMVSTEYFQLGDVFLHLNIACPICKGSGKDPDTGERCDHPGGLFNRIVVLNPDWIEVQQSPLVPDPIIVFNPDEELRNIIFHRQPKAIYDRIPDYIKELVMSGKPIPLSNRTTSHLKHMPVPYGTYGTALSRRLFTTLAYKTKLMTANWIVAERLILPVRVVKIGSDDRPATSADIADIQQQLASTANDPNLTIVTHNNFEYEWYGAAGKILQVTQELEWIGKEILDGFMLNQSLLNGEMSGYQSAQVGVETLIKRIDAWRHTLAEWAEENIFKPIAEMQGFIDEEKTEKLGETVYLYPKIKWNDLELKDKTQWYNLCVQLWDKQIISTQTLMEELGFKYDQEIKRQRHEQMLAGPMGAQMGGAGGAGGMGAAGGGAAGPGGGGMGGPGGGDMMGGGMGGPGGGMGGPGGGDMGGGMGGGGMGGGGMGAAAGGGGGGAMKVMKPGKGKDQEQDQQAQPMGFIKLTGIEQKMAQLLEDVAAANKLDPRNIRVQFPVENPNGGKRLQLDFAIPHIKMDIECDGEIWHGTPQQEMTDKERDYMLARQGWTVLRFDDKVIDDAPEAVSQAIGQQVVKLMQAHGKKTASKIEPEIKLFTLKGNGAIDLGLNYDKYFAGMPARAKEVYATAPIGKRDVFRNIRYSNLTRQSEVFKQ